jgi:putative two-component system hydrogenase maturation factor HypX/HoxX
MVLEQAARLASTHDFAARLDRKRAARLDDERRRPLEAYRIRELAEMSRDIFDDRHGFAEARHAFVTKRKPLATPSHLAGRPVSDRAVPDRGVVATVGRVAV